ncbi:MAG: glycosyltransferase family 2 protein [Alistipes sp.]|nr:glycosyltransferase family 2 protein [Alistipes sp.]
MSTVKIVILNWNGTAHLRRYLPGVVAAAPEGVGVVVADNGSTDGSADMLRREFPSVELVRLDRNYGFAGGYNRALAQIEADYYVLLNSDVETPAGWLEPLVECLDRHPDVAAAAPKLLCDTDRTRFEYAGASGGYIDYLGYPFCRGRILRTIERDEGQYDDARDVFWVSGAAFCCRAGVFHALGGFDDDFFAHMEEIDLCWRMQLAGWRVRIVPQSTVYHLGGGTLTADSPAKVFYNHRNNLAMLCKCAAPGQRLVAALVRPWLDLLAAGSYLAQGRWDNFCAVFRAWRDFLKWHSALARKRRAVGSTRVPHPRLPIYRGSVLLRYFFGCRTFGRLLGK